MHYLTGVHHFWNCKLKLPNSQHFALWLPSVSGTDREQLLLALGELLYNQNPN